MMMKKNRQKIDFYQFSFIIYLLFLYSRVVLVKNITRKEEIMSLSKIKWGLLATAAVGLLTVSTPSYASVDGTDWLAKERFQIRARMIDVAADGDGHVENTALQTDVEHSITPEIDLTYFFTDHIAAELIAATSEHEINADNLNLGEAWILPPTLTLQYHFQPEEKFSPYIGAGINYSMFYGESDGTGFNDLDVDGGVGYALQAGFDYWLNENWGLNMDVKYIDLNVDVAVNNAPRLHARDVDLDPWIFGVGVSYRF